MLKIKKSSEVPWKNVFNDGSWYTCYHEDDRYIFVSRDKSTIGLITALENAYKLAAILPTEEGCGHQIIVRIGENAGQEIDWPYLELIKVRREMDEQQDIHGPRG